jgi:hypothetical protein
VDSPACPVDIRPPKRDELALSQPRVDSEPDEGAPLRRRWSQELLGFGDLVRLRLGAVHLHAAQAVEWS